MFYSIATQQPRNPQCITPIKQILVPRHVIKYKIRQGVGRTPIPGDQISACMKCYTIAGQQIANTQSNLVKYFFGYNRLIKGLQIALATVQVGQKCRIIISPQYAYGDENKTSLLKANTKLIFEFSIRSIAKKQANHMTGVQYFAITIHQLKLVDEALAIGDYNQAHIHFQKAFAASDHVKHFNDKIKLHIGLKWAKVLRYQNRLKEALQKVNLILKTNPSWLKGFRFLKQLYIQMGEMPGIDEKMKDMYKSKLDERMKDMYKNNEENIKIAKFFVEYLRKYGKKLQLKQVPGYCFLKGDIIDKEFEQHYRKKRQKQANRLKRLHLGFFQLRYF